MQIWKDQQPCLLFEVASVDANDTQDALSEDTVTQPRDLRKSLLVRATSWKDTVAKGKGFLQMLKCGSGTPSEFDKYEDLEHWGWKVDYDMHPNSDFESSYLRSVEYLEASYSEEETFQVIYKHDVAVTVDGEEYPPTGADYSNIYAPEFIICQNNWGPRVSGPDQIPPVEESFPKLERQSDVMFLEYQRKMNYLNKPMTGLKGILRDHVVNKETQAIVARALDMRSWIIGSKPSWPGHDFDINSDEAAAIIASPNGRAAVWLLATHKEQLGHKTISKVRVFSQGTAMYILFGFEDVGNDSDDDEDGGVPLDSGHSTATVSAAAIAPRLAQLQSKTVVEESGDGQQMSIAVPNKIAVVEQSAASGVAGRGIGMTPQKYQVLLEKGRKLVSAFKSGEDCFAQSEFTEYEDLADWGWEVTQDDRRGPMRTTTSSTVFNFLGASWDANVNRWVHDKHGKTTQRDGKTYLSTGARYSNHFNPLVIIAKSNYGPAYNVPKQRPPVTGGLNDPYPVLAQLSDIFFLEFQRVMEEQNQPMNTLKGVWRDYVVNQDTKDLAIWITDADGMLHNIPRWPGEDFAADSDGFAALLACPNGVGVAYLLLQHQKQLGQKTITSVKVWYDMGLHILFLIGDKEGKRTTPPSRRRTLDSPNTDLSLYSDSTGVDLQPRVLDDATFANLTETGKAFVLALQSTDTCITQSEWTTEDSLNTWGWNRARQTNVDPTSSLNATKIVYDFVGASIGTDANHRATDTHSDKEVVDGNIYYQTGAKFDSLYNSALISVLSIRGVEYQGKTQDPPVTGDPNPYPKLKLWSDVTFLEYQQFMKDSGQAVDGLKAVWHSAIINSETLDLASRLCKVDDWTNIPVWPGKDFEPGTDEFAAMIGSDNGKGVVYLLLQHREQLGSRSITNARIWKDNTLQILYTIDDTCAGNASLTPTTPSLIRRADEPDSQKLNDARDAGRFLLMAQDADTKTLDECLSIKQSTFTETTQMDEFGWTRLANRAELIDEENNNAIFNCWHELNLDVSENKNRLVEYQHLDQSTGSDGTVYYPSGAYYQNMFNEEGIVALDNASPWKTGPKKNPPVDGRTRPFPPLRQWSDVVFPIYKDICEDDPVRMKKLKAVLQQTVSNAISRDALHEYMAKNGDLVENKPKVWPGTDYNLDDDGFNVALGIPNGKGIAYLLATHREDLGWKEVYKIRIFSVSWASRYNILYYIRHHQDSATRRDRPTAPLKIGGNGIAPGEVIPHENHLAGREKAVESVVPTGEAATKFHWKRADDEAAYYSNLRRGVLLRCKIHTDAASEPQSQWVNYKSLWYYGWEDEELDEDENFGDRMGEILKALDCPADLSANQQRFLAHRFDSDDHGQDYPATNAVYHNRFNVECGAIIAELNNGPAAAVRDQPDFPLIPLRQYSDVIFLEWQEMARDNVKNLKYVIRSSIINQETKAVLRYIFAKRRVQLGPWPGLHIETSHEDAWAIMGTPNGRGVAWMLIQHKVQLGLKYISGVTVWQDHDHWSFCIFIKDMEDGASDADLPLDLEELQSDAGESEELFANQARAAPLFDTATGITTEYPRIRAGGRLTKALAKRLGDSMKNLWTAMWLA